MRISVITRTLKRPLLFARAARSIADAQVNDMEWIVVEDAVSVSPDTVRIIEKTPIKKVKHITSGGHGRTAAANAGLKAASGVFVHFHDDDDTVEQEFYYTVLKYLDENPHYKGARAFCRRIYERVDGSHIRKGRSRRIYPERRTVSLMSAAEVFAYPPIGSVFDRQTLLELGGFDESFDVGEDYDILLRFLTRADIGTVASCLANVHVRQDGPGPYANSPMEQRFEEQHAKFCDALLRRDLTEGRIGLGFLLALGRLSRQSSTLFDYLDAARRRIGF